MKKNMKILTLIFTIAAVFAVTENVLAAQCSDGINNDLSKDAFIDFPDDPGCLNPEDNDESDHAPTLRISGDMFTVNGNEQFLLGVSYFDARNWSESDFQRLSEKRFNLIRAWAHWNEMDTDSQGWRSYFDIPGGAPNGTITNENKNNLLKLIRTAGKHGIMVDVTILSTKSFGGNLQTRKIAVENVAGILKNEPNVFFDIMNEHNHQDTSGGRTALSHSNVGTLISAGEIVDGDAIFTVSGTGDHHTTDPWPGTNFYLNTTVVNEEVNQSKVHLLAPHLPRGADWATDTANRVTLIKNHMSSIGRQIPIYLQEDQRRNWNKYNPPASDFLLAATSSKSAGAAAWIFHTRAGFDMRNSDFFANLDPDGSGIELGVINTLADAVFAEINPPEGAIEAESGTLKSPMYVGVDAGKTSGDRYITTTGTDTTDCTEAVTGSASYTIPITQAGQYKITGRVNALNASDDSFCVQVDGGTVFPWAVQVTGGGWLEDEINIKGTPTDPYITPTLSLGNHTLKIIGRESDAKLDYFYLTNTNPTFLSADVNSDTFVNSQDITLCVNVILGMETTPAIVARAKAVVVPLDSCNVLDLQAIVNEILK